MLGPLVAAGLVDVAAHLYPTLLALAATGTAATLAALLLAAAAQSDVEAVRTAVAASAAARAVSLVALLVPGHKAVAAVRTALGGSDAAAGGLDAAYPELAALEGLRQQVIAAARSDPAEPAPLAAAVEAALAILPTEGPAAGELARGLVTEAVVLALEEGDAALVARVVPALAAAVARAAGGAVAAGVSALNAAQLAVAAKEAEGIPEDSALAAFKALFDGAVVTKEALAAWVAGGEGVAEPAGRSAALAQAQTWVAAL